MAVSVSRASHTSVIDLFLEGEWCEQVSTVPRQTGKQQTIFVGCAGSN